MYPILLLFATAASCVSATNLGCPQHIFDELVARTSCVNDRLTSQCLLSALNVGRLDEIEQCYIAGGCPRADAPARAVWFAYDYRAEVREEEERIELRKRADPSDTSSDSATKSTTEKKSTEIAKSSTAAPSSAAASTTTVSTTSDAKQTSSTTIASVISPTTSKTSSTITSSSGSATSSTSSSTSSSTTSGSSSITTGTLLCSITQTIQTSQCAVSAGQTISCYSTSIPTSFCAPGNLCQVNTDGQDTCMKVDNRIGPAGIAIAIIFGSAIVIVAVGILVMSFKANNGSKTREAEHEALLA